MKVYLVQHGLAKDEEEDPARPLTSQGNDEVNDVVARLDDYLEVGRIVHSPKLRARQTADIFASSLGVSSSEVEGLKPMDDPKIARDSISENMENLMLVGHLPHLDKLNSLLLMGDPGMDLIKFRNGGVVCLEKDKGWRINWIVTPDTL